MISGTYTGVVVTCPGCGLESAPAKWSEAESYCEDCGSHSAFQCPLCGWLADHVRNDDLYRFIRGNR